MGNINWGLSRVDLFSNLTRITLDLAFTIGLIPIISSEVGINALCFADNSLVYFGDGEVVYGSA